MTLFRNILGVLWGILAVLSAYLGAYFISGGQPAAVQGGIVYFSLGLAILNLAALALDRYQKFCILVLGCDTATLITFIVSSESIASGIYTSVSLLLTIIYLYHQHIAQKL